MEREAKKRGERLATTRRSTKAKVKGSGLIFFPESLGRPASRVAVIAPADRHEEVRQLGAVHVNTLQDFMMDFKEGLVQADIILCATEYQRKIRSFARQLGSKLPRAKQGHVTDRFDLAIPRFQSGIPYVIDSHSMVRVPIGPIGEPGDPGVEKLRANAAHALRHFADHHLDEELGGVMAIDSTLLYCPQTHAETINGQALASELPQGVTLINDEE